MLGSLRRVAFAASFSALLAACSASAVNLNVPTVRDTSVRATMLSRYVSDAARPDGARSWMRAESRSSQLLYISDVRTNDVYVYAYPAGTLAGTLTGFKEPQGECSDAEGNVWIADTQRSRIVEYAHGGSTPVATLSDPKEYPGGCAVDQHGNLAVTNIVTTTGGAGSVAWFAGARGKPKLIASPNFRELYFAGFDRDGNLFVDGWPPNFARAVVGEVARGSNALALLNVTGGTIEYPGGVQVARGTVNVGDQIQNATFQLTENGTVTGVTPLDGAADCVQGTIARKTFVCPDSGNAAVEFFQYPSGGTPKRVISGPSEPTGSALSTAQH